MCSDDAETLLWKLLYHKVHLLLLLTDLRFVNELLEEGPQLGAAGA